ncbi:MAG: hypothetical protein IJ491_02430 [Clostridia bacterium]|nr:hypothetical protein [Clostridia bacterium]
MKTIVKAEPLIQWFSVLSFSWVLTPDYFLIKVYLTSLLCTVVQNGKVLFIPLTPFARAAWALTFVKRDKSKQKHAGRLTSAKTKNTESGLFYPLLGIHFCSPWIKKKEIFLSVFLDCSVVLYHGSVPNSSN